MSHYYAVNFFSSNLVSPVLEGNLVNIYVVCDQENTKKHDLHIRGAINQYFFFFSKTCDTEILLILCAID